jgi:invasion protein IalB
MAMLARIFINYRRDDSTGAAGRLHDRLAQTFGRKNLFMDVDHIPAGVDFVNYLNIQVAQCDVFLAIIGPNWLHAKDESGGRRIDNPDDFVAIEIAAALARNIPVIPVLIDGARMPKATELPEALRPFVRRHALEVRHSQFGRDAEALVAKVRAALGDKGAGLSRSRLWMVTSVATLAMLLLIGWSGYAFVQHIFTQIERQAELRWEALKAEEERKAKEAEQQRIAAKAEEERKAEEAEQQRIAAAKAEEERKAKAAAEAEARAKAEQAEKERLAAAKAEEERRAREAEQQRLAAAKAEEERRAREAEQQTPGPSSSAVLAKASTPAFKTTPAIPIHDRSGVYWPWTKFCEKREPQGREICRTFKEVQSESGQFLASAALIEQQGEEKKLLRVTFPAATKMQGGVALQIDSEPPIQRPFSACQTNGCIADFDANAELMARLKRGANLIIARGSSQGQVTSYTLYLTNFADANGGLPSDPRRFEADQKNFVEALRNQQSGKR